MNMQFLLEKSSIFTKVLKDQMDRTREKHAAIPVATQNRPTRRSRSSARGSLCGADRDEENARMWRVTTNVTLRTKEGRISRSASVKVLANDVKPAFLQPAWSLVPTLKGYQLEGVAWMVSLWEDGISGILGESLRRLFIVRYFIESGL